MKVVNLGILAIILGSFLLLFFKGCEPPAKEIVKIDTVKVYITVRDTVFIEKPVYISTKKDTIWITREENKPDSSYNGLLAQYKELGEKHFSTNIFKTTFPISDYGFITIKDSISENRLLNSQIFTDLTIPTYTITVEKEREKRNEVYLGGEIELNKSSFFSGMYISTLLKNKSDNILGFSMGYGGGEPQYKLSYFQKIKLKK